MMGQSDVTRITKEELRKLSFKDLKDELTLHNDKVKIGTTYNDLVENLLFIFRKGAVAKSPIFKDLALGIKPVKAIVNYVVLNSRLLSLLTGPQLAAEARNQKVSLPETGDKLEIIIALLAGMRNNGTVNLPYTPPLRNYLMNLSCPQFFGAALYQRTDDTSLLFSLTKADIIGLGGKVMKEELVNQGMETFDERVYTDDYIADYLLITLRAKGPSRMTYTKEFSRFMEFKRMDSIEKAREDTMSLDGPILAPVIQVPYEVIGLSNEEEAMTADHLTLTNKEPQLKEPDRGIISQVRKMSMVMDDNHRPIDRFPVSPWNVDSYRERFMRRKDIFNNFP